MHYIGTAQSSRTASMRSGWLRRNDISRGLTAAVLLLALSKVGAQGTPAVNRPSDAVIEAGGQTAVPATPTPVDCYAGPVARGVSRAVGRQRAAAAAAATPENSALRWSATAKVLDLPYYKEPSPEVTAALYELNSQSMGPDTIVQKVKALGKQSAAAAAEGSSAARLGSNITVATTAIGAGELPGVTVQSICSGDPKFSQTKYSRTICRLQVNLLDGYTALCTAWFVTNQHVVTAGHCSADVGKYIVDPRDPGMLCCGFDAIGNCFKAHTWRLLAWVTTTGWWKHGLTETDGSVYKVEPWYLNITAGAKPQKIQSFYPGPIPQHVAYLDGFPAHIAQDKGCGVVNENKRYYTRAKVMPLAATGSGSAGSNGMPVTYPLAGCMGESGGRVLLGGPNGPAYGIQTFGSPVCRSNRGSSGVTQIVPACAAGMTAGVCIDCLVAALP